MALPQNEAIVKVKGRFLVKKKKKTKLKRCGCVRMSQEGEREHAPDERVRGAEHATVVRSPSAETPFAPPSRGHELRIVMYSTVQCQTKT